MSDDDAKTQIGQTIEGLKTLKVVKIISDEHKVKMPIVDSLYKIIYKGNSLDGSIQNVLGPVHFESSHQDYSLYR